jgi:hypothetical protein
LLQIRLYRLLVDPETSIKKYNYEGYENGVGVGVSLIGWIPDSQEEFYINREACIS